MESSLSINQIISTENIESSNSCIFIAFDLDQTLIQEHSGGSFSLLEEEKELIKWLANNDQQHLKNHPDFFKKVSSYIKGFTALIEKLDIIKKWAMEEKKEIYYGIATLGLNAARAKLIIELIQIWVPSFCKENFISAFDPSLLKYVYSEGKNAFDNDFSKNLYMEYENYSVNEKELFNNAQTSWENRSIKTKLSQEEKWPVLQSMGEFYIRTINILEGFLYLLHKDNCKTFHLFDLLLEFQQHYPDKKISQLFLIDDDKETGDFFLKYFISQLKTYNQFIMAFKKVPSIMCLDSDKLAIKYIEVEGQEKTYSAQWYKLTTLLGLENYQLKTHQAEQAEPLNVTENKLPEHLSRPFGFSQKSSLAQARKEEAAEEDILLTSSNLGRG